MSALARIFYYGRTAAPLAKRHPGNARPLHVSPWTTAAWAALALKRPKTALAITAAAVGLLARELPLKTAAELAGLGTLRSGRVVADALTRTYWPLAPLAPRVYAAAALADPLKLPDEPGLRSRRLARLPPAPHAPPAAAVTRMAPGTAYCRPMGVIARLAAGRRSKWVVIAAWLLATAVAIPFQSKLQALASDESGAFQDRDAESTRVSELIEQRFPGGADTTALVLYTRDDAAHAAGRRARRGRRARSSATAAASRTSCA